MMKKTNILVVSLVAIMSAGVARSETATTDYVDSQDNQLYSRMQTQDSRIATIRDWVNPKQNGSFATLNTNAKDAYGAINELNSGVQSLGTNLVTVRNWVNHKENGEFVTLNTTAQDAYGAINELNTAVGAKANSADLAPVATSGSYNDLTDKPAAQDLSGYATTAAMNTALADKADASDLETLEGLVATSGQTIPSTIGSTNNVTTIVGAINALNTKTNSMPTDDEFTELTTRVGTAEDDIDALEAKVGTDAMGTTATTVTGAIAELGDEIDDLGDEIDTKQDILVASGNGQNIQGTGSVTVTKDANGMITINGTDDNTTYSTGTASVEGLTKLYASAGENTDGTMTQAAIKTALDAKANSADLAPVATTGSYNDLTDKPAAQDLSAYATTSAMNTALGAKVDKGTVPNSGQYILGFIDGAQAYIPVVDANGDSGNIVYLNE